MSLFYSFVVERAFSQRGKSWF